MKIEPHTPTFGRKISRGDAAPQHTGMPRSFSDTMSQQEERHSQEQLKRMLDQIHLQGSRLAKSMTVRELRAYKLLVKQFLEETVKRGVKLKETRGWDRRGRTKRYKLLEEVDALLMSMGEEMLQNEQGRIELLDKVGEIRGLLLNVYF